jgi:hypothetical protein
MLPYSASASALSGGAAVKGGMGEGEWETGGWRVIGRRLAVSVQAPPRLNLTTA